MPQAVTKVSEGMCATTCLVDLTMAVVAINAWNRLAISMRSVPGG